MTINNYQSLLLKTDMAKTEPKGLFVCWQLTVLAQLQMLHCYVVSF